MKLKLTAHVQIVIFLLYKHKNPVQFWYLERHNYVTPWLIVIISVCMDRADQYLSIKLMYNQNF